MQPLQDYHCHTIFSFDGQTEPEKLIRRAAGAGITHLAVTDHADFVKGTPAEEQLEAHLKNFAAADREIAGAVERTRDLPVSTAFGIEIGQPLFAPEAARRLAGAFAFDVVLLSVHQILDYPDFYDLDYSACDVTKAVTEYFEEAEKSIRIADFDVFAHLFYPFRYLWQQGGNLPVSLFWDGIDTVLRLLAENGKALELNVSTMASGCEPMPPKRILRRFRELGGERITVGTDDHKLLYQQEFPARGLAIASEAGFRDYTVYEGRRAKAVRFVH